MAKLTNVLRIENETQQVQRRGAREAQAAAVKVRQLATREWRTKQPQDYERAIEERLMPAALNALVASYLKGFRRSQLLRRGTKVAPEDAISMAVSPNVKTLEYLALITGHSLPLLYRTFADEALNMVRNESRRVNRIVRDEIADLIGRGAHVREGVGVLGELFDRLGLTPKQSAPVRLEAIFRTQSQTAYNAGRWQADQDEDVQDILWGYEYSTVGDDRVRPEHAVLDGVRLPKNDPFWQAAWPPNGYNCRCIATPIMKGESEARARGATRARAFEPDDGFAFNAGAQAGKLV